MLNNKKVFERLMALLCNINPHIPLPAELESYLWKWMEVERFCYEGRELEREGEVPKKAYYVVVGFVLVFGFDEDADRFVWRIYRSGSIVALNSFMRERVSEYTLWACRGTQVWSIDRSHMNRIYSSMPGMREMAQDTAADFNEQHERMRMQLLALPVPARIRKFYLEFPEFLPARKSPVSDEQVAGFIQTTVRILRRHRFLLKKIGLMGR